MGTAQLRPWPSPHSKAVVTFYSNYSFFLKQQMDQPGTKLERTVGSELDPHGTKNKPLFLHTAELVCGLGTKPLPFLTSSTGSSLGRVERGPPTPSSPSLPMQQPHDCVRTRVLCTGQGEPHVVGFLSVYFPIAPSTLSNPLVPLLLPQKHLRHSRHFTDGETRVHTGEGTCSQSPRAKRRSQSA